MQPITDWKFIDPNEQKNFLTYLAIRNEQMAQMKEMGKTWRQIGQIVGLSKGYVKQVVHKYKNNIKKYGYQRGRSQAKANGKALNRCETKVTTVDSSSGMKPKGFSFEPQPCFW